LLQGTPPDVSRANALEMNDQLTQISSDERVAALVSLCPGVQEETIRDFVTRMDPDYFQQRPSSEVARHVRLAGRLDLDHLSEVDVTRRDVGLSDIVVVAYDYFSEFAIICGLLSAFGLDIREGSIYTFADASPAEASAGSSRGPGGGIMGRTRTRRSGGRTRAGLSRKKIVDLFRVHPTQEATFDAVQQQRFAGELEEMLRLLDAGRLQEARHRVNRLLVETLTRSRSSSSGLLNPVHIAFDNVGSATDTIMAIQSTDTPAFLYAFASALAMRGLYIRKARFENVGKDLRDWFYVRGRHGQKIEEPHEQQELRVTATLIKQFTHYLGGAPDPAKAMDSFDQFLDRLFHESRDGSALRRLNDQKTLGLLAKLLGTSDFLWEDFLRRQYDNLLPMLEQYQRLPLIRDRATLTRELRRRLAKSRTDDQRRRALNEYKDQELFRIDMKHLLTPETTIQDFSRALTELAETVLGEAARACEAKLARTFGSPRLASGRPCPFAIFGMGKFGGRELGYASDIELLFVYGGPGRTSGRHPLDTSEFFERLVQEILQWIEARQEGIFHLDVRLRPHGGKGLLANTLDEIRTYYNRGGLSAPFERQALIKLRHVWGDPELGAAVESHRDRFVYGGEPWDIPAALELRRQQIRELAGSGGVNVKYSPGGLIDVEYAVQYLQLMHGHRHPSLRTSNTLEAITMLGTTKALRADEVRSLREAYVFLRTLIDALRIVRGNAKDLVIPAVDSEAFVFLSRRLGYWTETWEEGARRLATAIMRTMQDVEGFFTRHFATARTSGPARQKVRPG
jgi:glutamate-ammonia-ligase adenylyltransferase